MKKTYFKIIPVFILGILIFTGKNIFSATIYNTANDVTPLYQACDEKNFSRVKALVESGANVNQRNSNIMYRNHDDTPIYPAIENGDFRTVKYLVEHGANINISSSFWGTPLNTAFATSDKNAEIIPYLIKKGADVNRISRITWDHKYDGALIHHLTNEALTNHILSNTARYDHCIAQIQILLKYGADINLPYSTADDKYRNMSTPTGSPLHLAVYGNCPELVSFFVEHGADINAQNDHNQTPICIAEQKKFVVISDYLKQHGAKYEGTECYNEFRNNERSKIFSSTGHFLLYQGIPLLYLGSSIWLYESKYKHNRSKNAMGTVNAYTLIVPASMAVCGLLGVALYPDHSSYGEDSLIIGGGIGVLVGIPVGILIVRKNHLENKFKTNRGLYYAAPALATGITLFAFTKSF
jgi:ankyrin repeat protein